MRSDAQRRADAAYRQKPETRERQKAAYKSVACMLPPDIAEQFREKCAERGTTVSAVLKAAVEKFMSE